MANKGIYLKSSMALLIICSQVSAITSLDIPFATDILGTGFCGLISVQEISQCADRFDSEVADSRHATDELSKRGVCCAINHLKDCIVDAIGKRCGDEQKKKSDTIVSAIISAVKIVVTRDECNDNYYYGSVLCYSDVVLILMATGLAFLPIFVICFTIKICCSCRSRHLRNSPSNVVLIPVDNRYPNADFQRLMA